MKRIILLLALFFRPALDIGETIGNVGGMLTGAMGLGGASGNPTPNYWTPGASQEMDEKWYRAMQAIEKSIDRNTGMVDPIILDSFSKMLGIDLGGLVQAGFAQGNQYGGLAERAGQYGGQMQQQAGASFGRGQDIWNTARDPQNQLHDYIKNQVSQDVRGADSARGIAMGGVSAGNEVDAQRKFEMDWQNQQLGRQVTGGQGANAAGQMGGQQMGASMGYYGMQPQFTGASAQAPVAGQQMAYGMPMDYASQFTQAQGQNVIDPYSRIQQNIQPYLGMAAQMGPTKFGQQSGAYGQGFGMAQGGMGDIFTGMSQMPWGQFGGSMPFFGGGGGAAAIGANAADALPAMMTMA